MSEVSLYDFSQFLRNLSVIEFVYISRMYFHRHEVIASVHGQRCESGCGIFQGVAGSWSGGGGVD